MGELETDNYKVEAIITEDQFLDRKTEWKAFEKKLGNVDFNSSYDFLVTFWQYFKDASDIQELGIARQLFILFLYKHEELIAIFPFWKIKRKRKKIFYVVSIEFIGQQVFSNYNDIIAKEITSGEFQIVNNWLYKHVKFDFIFLNHIPSFSKNIRSVYKKKIYPFNQCAEINLFADQTYQDYKHNMLSANFKHTINNAYNRINKASIRLDLIFKDFENEDIREFQRISTFKTERGKYNIYADRLKKKFLSEMYHKFETKVLYLRFDNKNISYLTYIHHNNQTIWFDMAFDTTYQKFRPGILLYDNCLKESIKDRSYYNVVGWGMDFHKRFCNHFVTLYQYLQKGNAMGGKIWYLLKEKQIIKTAEEYKRITNNN